MSIDTYTDDTELGTLGDLGDIPDLAVFEQADKTTTWENGWYRGTILDKREFTDKVGNNRVFETNDTPAQRSGRNIRLQVAITRKADSRVLNTSVIVNYQPSDLSQEMVQAIAERREQVKSDGTAWGELFRPFMTLVRLSKLQKIAGVRQLQHNGDGGLLLDPLYGKTAYFKLAEDTRNPQFKEVKDFQDNEPKRVPVY
jgi:hypothetical protein